MPRDYDDEARQAMKRFEAALAQPEGSDNRAMAIAEAFEYFRIGVALEPFHLHPDLLVDVVRALLERRRDELEHSLAVEMVMMPTPDGWKWRTFYRDQLDAVEQQLAAIPLHGDLAYIQQAQDARQQAECDACRKRECTMRDLQRYYD